jgi:hypothetical protein
MVRVLVLPLPSVRLTECVLLLECVLLQVILLVLPHQPISLIFSLYLALSFPFLPTFSHLLIINKLLSLLSY